jgi:MFS superfamily sulfate permease-like transporter
VHSSEPALQAAPAPHKLLALFAIILLAGLLQALFGLLKLGTLIKLTPHPVIAGFQNMAALLLFLVQLGNILGYEHNVPLPRLLSQIQESKPLSVAVAAITFIAMWNARRITAMVPPLLVGLTIGIAVDYALLLAGLSTAPSSTPKTPCWSGPRSPATRNPSCPMRMSRCCARSRRIGTRGSAPISSAATGQPAAPSSMRAIRDRICS